MSCDDCLSRREFLTKSTLAVAGAAALATGCGDGQFGPTALSTTATTVSFKVSTLPGLATTGQLVKSISLQGANLSASRDTRLPDMLLARSGAMIVSSNAQPSLWRISPERFEVERFDVEVDRDHDKDFGFSDLAWSADGRELHAVSAATGSAWRIDLARGKATKVGVE